MFFKMSFQVRQLSISYQVLGKDRKENLILTLFKCKVYFCLNYYVSCCSISEFCKTEEDKEKDGRVIKEKQILLLKEV